MLLSLLRRHKALRREGLVPDVLIDISVAIAFGLLNSVVIQGDVTTATINEATTVDAFRLNALIEALEAILSHVGSGCQITFA
jgi:hypothetical protein